MINVHLEKTKDIFDEDHFIDNVKSNVRIMKKLPRAGLFSSSEEAFYILGKFSEIMTLTADAAKVNVRKLLIPEPRTHTTLGIIVNFMEVFLETASGT
nr:hypothetical protein [Tanacetum cinerariifolium]